MRGRRPRELDGEAIQLAGRRQRARQEHQRHRAGAGAPPADRVASRASEDSRALVVDERPDGRMTELAARRPGKGIDANDGDRNLERGERRAARGEDGVVAWIDGAGAEDDRGDRDLPQRSSVAPPRPLRDRRLGRRTASTSAGETFSPPRTMRSSRRSATNRRPVSSSRPRSPVRIGPSDDGSPRYPANRAGVSTTISPTPSAPGFSIVTRTPGSGRPALDGASRASSVASAVTPEPASLRP